MAEPRRTFTGLPCYAPRGHPSESGLYHPRSCAVKATSTRTVEDQTLRGRCVVVQILGTTVFANAKDIKSYLVGVLDLFYQLA